MIGDKHGEGFLLSVQARPWLADAVINTMSQAGHELCFVHVVRNPYDAIASVATSAKRGRSLDQAIDYFEGLYKVLQPLRQRLGPEQLCEIRFEEFRADPRARLARACAFLGCEASDGYLDACASIMLDELEDHRGRIQWSAESRDRVAAMIDRYPFLTGYRFED